MSQGPSFWVVWLLWWRMWYGLPRCEGECNQAHKPCNCRKEQQ